MSTAWKGPLVLLREPASAVWRRAGIRLVVAAALGAAAWFAPWTWLAVVAWIVFSLVFLLLLLAFANVAMNRRVLLVMQASGAILRPPSIQERLLRRSPEWVAGTEVSVTEPELTVVPSRPDPRVTLAAGERTIARVPLYGMDPAAFVNTANDLLAGRDTRLVHVEPRPTQ